MRRQMAGAAGSKNALKQTCPSPHSESATAGARRAPASAGGSVKVHGVPSRGPLGGTQAVATPFRPASSSAQRVLPVAGQEGVPFPLEELKPQAWKRWHLPAMHASDGSLPNTPTFGQG